MATKKKLFHADGARKGGSIQHGTSGDVPNHKRSKIATSGAVDKSQSPHHGNPDGRKAGR